VTTPAPSDAGGAPRYPQRTRALAAVLLVGAWVIASVPWFGAFIDAWLVSTPWPLVSVVILAAYLAPFVLVGAILRTLPPEVGRVGAHAVCTLLPALAFLGLLLLVVDPVFDWIAGALAGRTELPLGRFAGVGGVLYALWLVAALVPPQQFLARALSTRRRAAWLGLAVGAPIVALQCASAPDSRFDGLLPLVALALVGAGLFLAETWRVALESSEGLRLPLLEASSADDEETYRRVGAETVVGIAMSGGGYRASLFALGALMYVHEACARGGAARRRIAAVASVSGGSVTNGLAAHALKVGVDDAAALDAMCRRLIRHTTRTGSMFQGAAGRYYRGLFVMGVLALGLAWLWVRSVDLGVAWHAAALVAIPLGGWRVIRAWDRLAPPGKLAERIGPLLVIGTLLGTLALLVLTLGLPTWRHAMAWIAATLLAGTVVAVALELRGRLIEANFDALLSEGGPSPRLADAPGSTHHVFCATEVQYGESVFLARDQIRGRFFEDIGPGRLPTAAAVRASAAFPGAFPPLFLAGVSGSNVEGLRGRSADVPFKTEHMTLVDGGVRDNLGVDWFARALPVDELVVVSAAANRHDLRHVKRFAGIAEALSLLNIVNIPYNSRERNRRRSMWERMLQGTGRGPSQPRPVALVHIEDSPFDLAWKLKAAATGGTLTGRRFESSGLPPWDIDQWLAAEQLWRGAGPYTPVIAERAAAARSVLDAVEARLPDPPPHTTRDELDFRVATGQSPVGGDWSGGGSAAQLAWWMRTRVSAAVGTQLDRITTFEAVNLVLHGYYLAMANLHIVAGWPLLDTLDEARLGRLFEGPLIDPKVEALQRASLQRLRRLEGQLLAPREPLVVLWVHSVRVREAGEFHRKDAVVALGVGPTGAWRVLSLGVAPEWQDSGLSPVDDLGGVITATRRLRAEFWIAFLGDLQRRGLSDIGVLVRDTALGRELGGDLLVGLDAAIATRYPQAMVQPRPAALVDDLLMMKFSQREALQDELRAIVLAVDADAAARLRDAFVARRSEAHEALATRLVRDWKDLVPIYALTPPSRVFVRDLDQALIELRRELDRRSGARAPSSGRALALAALADDIGAVLARPRQQPGWAAAMDRLARERAAAPARTPA
jgi:transposase-like protein